MLRLGLARVADIRSVRLDGRVIEPERDTDGFLEIDVPRGGGAIVIGYQARFEQDVEAGERPGQIHNFAVDAHIGEEGIVTRLDEAFEDLGSKGKSIAS